jgi:hypothetical protein
VASLSLFRRHQVSAIIAVLLTVAVGLALGLSLPAHPKLTLELAAAALLVAVAIKHVEVAYAALFVVVVLGGAHVNDSVWTYLGCLTIGLVAVGEFVRQRRPVIPIVIVLYCAWFLIAATHNLPPTTGDRRSLVNYLVPPVVALATAWVGRDQPVRRRIVIFLLAVSVISAADVYVQFFIQGRRNDAVTGTFGGSNANILATAFMVPATVCFALGVERVWRPKLMFLLAVGLEFTGVLSSGRAIFAFVPLAFGGVLISYLVAGGSLERRRALVLLPGTIVLTAATVLAYNQITPGQLGPLSSPSKIQSYLSERNPGGALPGRLVQLKLASHEAATGGPLTFFAGRGVGATRYESARSDVTTSAASVSSTITASNSDDLGPFLSPEQRTGGIWIGQVLTETGWIGVVTLVALLGYLALLGSRTQSRLPPGSLDRALVVALPGLSLLALAGSTYSPMFFEPQFNVLFWPLVGICIAIAYGARKDTVQSNGREAGQ